MEPLQNPKWMQYVVNKGYNWLLDKLKAVKNNYPALKRITDTIPQYDENGRLQYYSGLGMLEFLNPESALKSITALKGAKEAAKFGEVRGPEVVKEYWTPDYKLKYETLRKDINTGRADAIKYLNSDVKAETDAHNIDLAARRGFGQIVPQNKPGQVASTEMVPLQIPTSSQEWLKADNWVLIEKSSPKIDGFDWFGRTSHYATDPSYDRVILRPWMDADDIAFHEFLHRGNVGTASRASGSKATDAFYKWKATKLLQDPKAVGEYIADPQELGVGLLETGRKYGLTPGQPYPGAEKAQTIFNEILANPNEKHIFEQTIYKDKPKRVWDALTGKYFTVPVVGITGAALMTNDND